MQSFDDNESYQERAWQRLAAQVVLAVVRDAERGDPIARAWLQHEAEPWFRLMHCDPARARSCLQKWLQLNDACRVQLLISERRWTPEAAQEFRQRRSIGRKPIIDCRPHSSAGDSKMRGTAEDIPFEWW